MSPIAANLAARVGAIASLSLTSLLVARVAGPAGVGTLVLLRVLPWLAGLLLGSVTHRLLHVAARERPGPCSGPRPRPSSSATSSPSCP